jgi:vancomycin permeability regulator SanA
MFRRIIGKHPWVKRIFIAICILVGLVVAGTGILIVAGLRDELGKADVALVLGSKVELDGTPSVRLRARLDRTVELYRAGYFPKVIASGGVGVEGFDEAAVMRDYLVAHGLPRDAVLVDSGGTTTFASAKNAFQMAQPEKFASVLVVSQYFHIPRARLALRRFGFATVYSAHAFYFDWRDLYSAPREFFGYLSYLLRSYP